MPNDTCIVPECTRAPKHSGVCHACYERRRRTGSLAWAAKPRAKDADTETHKLCSMCDEVKPRTEFHKAGKGKTKDGLRSCCKACMREANKQSRLRNYEAALEREAKARARPENKAYRDEYMPRYYSENYPAYSAYAAKRRATLADATQDPGITLTALREIHGDACHFCGVGMLFQSDSKRNPLLATIEHMVPLARGGTHTWDNTTLSCWDCNQRKNKKTPEEFRAWLLLMSKVAIDGEQIREPSL